MSNSTRYFQLTPDILVEYNYNSVISLMNQRGDATDHITDYREDGNNSYIISNGYCATRTFFWEGQRGEFVQSINKSESKFIKCIESIPIWRWNTDFGCETFSTSDNTDDLLSDRFRLHFTSRNYLGSNNYDGFILTVTIYDKYKNKVGLLSQYVSRTEDPTINENPTIINQKLYTTYIDFTIPNVYAIINSNEDWIKTVAAGENELRSKLFPNKGYDIMENTPIVMNIYGVKSTYENLGHEYYNVEKLNSIYIPVIDKSSNLVMKIDEADDGDYFKIWPEVNGGIMSLSDYIYDLSDGRPELYIVFHELTLTEHYTDKARQAHNMITHREQFIVNGSIKEKDDGDPTLDEMELDRIIFYRPVIRNSGNNFSFTIDVKTYIINTLDNTTIVKRTSIDYPDQNKPNQNAKKYGKKMNKIYIGDIPAQVNVYNKRPDVDTDGVKLTNASSNVKIENHQHSVIGFIECANVGVSIEQVPKEVL